MNKQKGFYLIGMFMVLFTISLCGQDSHYYSQQPDSRGTLNGGTGTAGSRELAAVFYNPGIVALFEESNIGLSGSLYTVDFVNVYEGGGELRDLNGSSFQVMPSILAGSIKWKKNRKLTTTYSYFNTGYYKNRLYTNYVDEKNENNTDYLYYNQYDVRTDYHEDWFGVGLSYRINEHWGIGMVPYLHFYSVRYMQRTSLDISPIDTSRQLVQGFDEHREARLFSPAVLFNIGLVYNNGDHEFGFTVITPRINVSSLAYSTVERSQSIYSETNPVNKSTLVDDDFKAFMKRPWEINLGYAYMHENKSFKIRLSYYSNIDPYTMGYESNSSIRYGIYASPQKYDYLPVSANNEVFNIGLGYEWKVTDKTKMVVGYRSDFTFFDKGRFTYSEFTTVLIHWNLHHFSTGIDWQYKWLRLNTGLDYGFSYEKGVSQFVNVETIGDGDYNFELSKNASVNYQQFKVFLGLVLSFSK